MLSLDFEGFNIEQIKAALHLIGGSRRVAYRYELLDENDNVKGDISDYVISGSIQQRAFAQIKRTAKFTLRENEFATTEKIAARYYSYLQHNQPMLIQTVTNTMKEKTKPDINYMTDKIKPYMRIFIPAGKVLVRYFAFFGHSQPALLQEIKDEKKSGWIEFPLGVFHLSSPTRKVDNGVVMREVEAYDGLVVLLDDRFEDRYTISAGTNYISAVKTILNGAGITKYNLEATTKTLDKDIEFEPGKEKLFAVNELLRQINYDPIHVDPNGYYTSFYYRSPSDRAAEYTYKTDDESVIFPEYEETLDVFDIPNKWVAVRTNNEQEPLISSYTNDNPNSPTSTVNRGRTIVDYREVQDIADQTTLDDYVKRIADEASQIFGYIEFETAIMPFHDYNDVIEINFTDLGVKGKYQETAWSFDLEAGAKMKHEIRRTVDI